MKKTYMKPEIIIENFTLSSQIASCGDIIRFSEDNRTCNNEITGDWTIWAYTELDNAFTGDITKCSEDYKILLGPNEQPCYNGLTAPFNS